MVVIALFIITINDAGPATDPITSDLKLTINNAITTITCSTLGALIVRQHPFANRFERWKSTIWSRS
jgi:hypothetical protein